MFGKAWGIISHTAGVAHIGAGTAVALAGSGLSHLERGDGYLGAVLGVVQPFGHHLEIGGLVVIGGGFLIHLVSHLWEAVLSKEVDKATSSVSTSISTGVEQVSASINTGLDTMSNAVQAGIEKSFGRAQDLIKSTTESLGPNVLKSWIDSAGADPGDVREVAVSALRRYYGNGLRSLSNDYIDYIFAFLLDPLTQKVEFFRRSFDVDITIGGKTANGHASWIEEKNYWVVPSRKGAVYPIRFLTRFAAAAVTTSLADAVTYEVHVGNNSKPFFNIKSFLTGLTLDKPGVLIDQDNLKVSYSEAFITIDYRHDLTLDAEEVRIRTYEATAISLEERQYHHLFHYPTKGGTLKVKLVDDLATWVIADPTFNLTEKFHPRSVPYIRPDDSPNRLTADIESWILPGIGFVVEWSPRRLAAEAS